ncbi:MAG: carboxypeptidase regulatory-like domain-containing protein [Candidatus Aminicenantes bacterium]|nr:carboxypeptidase regulatory-like domain-containing protein [Candidatus Aminicenantes bacterium]
MKKKNFFKILILALLLLLFFVDCREKGGITIFYGSIAGKIIDAVTGSAVKDVSITIVELQKETTSDSQGDYSFAQIETGAYTLKATASGYDEKTVQVTVNKDETANADFSLTPRAQGNTYYVATNGSDANPGTKEQPWASPGYASRRLSPGDTLIISGGKYILSEYDADILTPRSGTAAAYITIKGEENNRPILAGKDNLSHALALSSYLLIENLEITSHNGANFRDGISQLDTPVKNVTLKKLFIHHIDEFGLNVADIDNLTIENCKITYTGFGSIGGPEGQQGGWQNVVIDNCRLSYNGHYYQGGPGPGPYARPDGFGIEPSPGPIEIKYTTAAHNRGDGLDSKAGNTYIHNCIVANNSCDGIKLWAGDSKIENCLIYGTGDGTGGSSPWAGIVIDGETNGDKFEIINVTLHDNPQRQAYPMYVGYDRHADITVTMKNCIAANGYGLVYFGSRVTAVLEYNVFYRPGSNEQVEANGRVFTTGDIENGELGAGNIVRDPLFISPAWGKSGDYHLQLGSPAIDAGTAVGAPAIDLEGNPRPVGSGYDIGAYEKQ